ncbi:MAG TPA: FecR family protein [Steroidobacteraceae bacterium]|nr:FecR family protein [Steroidobacteraceae bacterium]
MNDPSSQIESLLRLAGERDQPSPDGLERARAAARVSWERMLETRASPGAAAMPVRRMGWGWALAACLAIAGAVTFWPRGRAPVVVEVARVSAVDGQVRVATIPVPLAAILRSGDVLSTADGRVALAIGDVLSLRLDRHTRLRLDAPDVLTLLEGAVYVDSGGLNVHTALRIDTPAGAVRHVGTQFQVSVRATRTRVQVREGRVVMTSRDGEALDLGAGDLADVGPGTLQIEHGQSGSGAAWEWAAAIAPPFDIENRPLSEFLAWLAREHGWQVRYADAAAQSRARDIRLHGSLTGLDADRMLERASLITGEALSVREGSLLVGAHP